MYSNSCNFHILIFFTDDLIFVRKPVDKIQIKPQIYYIIQKRNIIK